MPGSLKQFIARRLKENVPLAEIKQDLKEKGYDMEAINKAVREAIAGIDKKLPAITIVQLSVLVIGVVMAVGVAVYFTGNKTSAQYAFCNDFEGLDYKITCGRAVEIALANTPGTVQKVSIDSVRTIDPSTEPPSRITADMWLVDVKLEKPYFDQNFNREIHVARIGVGLNEHLGIYKEVLE